MTLASLVRGTRCRNASVDCNHTKARHCVNYYIDHGIAYMGAFSLYQNYKKDPDKSIGAYLNFISHGFERGITESYKMAGLDLIMSRSHMENIAKTIENLIGE